MLKLHFSMNMLFVDNFERRKVKLVQVDRFET